jgi:pimeloyl-ACP methyl ester carboxylesterase
VRSILLFLLLETATPSLHTIYAQAVPERGRPASEEKVMVSSKDGTSIAVRKSGSGPAILLIHGMGADSQKAWGRVIPLLNYNHTVYAMDLRGHGESGDGPDYSISRDGDDIAAVLKMIGRPATVVAHSYGGLAVIASLDRLQGIDRLILYEPAVLTQPMSTERVKLLEEIDRALAADDLDRALVAVARSTGAPEQMIEQFRRTPDWKAELSRPRLEMVRSRLREHERFRPSTQTLSKYTRETKMLLGSKTTGWLQQSAKAICEQLPRCQLVILEGQGHYATDRAPELFVSKLLDR